MRKFLHINWFKSPAQVFKYIHKNKIKPKNIIAITRYNNQLELWFWSKRICSDLTHQHEDKGE